MRLTKKLLKRSYNDTIALQKGWSESYITDGVWAVKKNLIKNLELFDTVECYRTFQFTDKQLTSKFEKCRACQVDSTDYLFDFQHSEESGLSRLYRIFIYHDLPKNEQYNGLLMAEDIFKFIGEEKMLFDPECEIFSDSIGSFFVKLFTKRQIPNYFLVGDNEI